MCARAREAPSAPCSAPDGELEQSKWPGPKAGGERVVSKCQRAETKPDFRDHKACITGEKCWSKPWQWLNCISIYLNAVFHGRRVPAYH